MKINHAQISSIFFRVQRTNCIRFDQIVPNAVIPRAFNFRISRSVVNQLSKHKVWYLCWRRCFTNHVTEPSEEQFSVPTLSLPLLKKEDIHNSWCSCSHKHLESPFNWLFGIELLYSTSLCSRGDDLLIFGFDLLLFNFQTVCPNCF